MSGCNCGWATFAIDSELLFRLTARQNAQNMTRMLKLVQGPVCASQQSPTGRVVSCHLRYCGLSLWTIQEASSFHNLFRRFLFVDCRPQIADEHRTMKNPRGTWPKAFWDGSSPWTATAQKLYQRSVCSLWSVLTDSHWELMEKTADLVEDLTVLSEQFLVTGASNFFFSYIGFLEANMNAFWSSVTTEIWSDGRTAGCCKSVLHLCTGGSPSPKRIPCCEQLCDARLLWAAWAVLSFFRT